MDIETESEVTQITIALDMAEAVELARWIGTMQIPRPKTKTTGFVLAEQLACKILEIDAENH